MDMVQPIMMTVMRVITVTIIVLQELLPTKGLNYLGHIPHVMHQEEEEVMLGKFILDPALAVSGWGGPEKKPKFWNANFVSLASMYAMKVPNSHEKEILRKAGLGVRKIKLNLQDNEDEVSKKLCWGDIITGDDEENLQVGYPQLADFGGFELMVCQPNSRQLTVLDCTLSTKDLRARIGRSQSKLYIRLIQNNLSLKPIIKDKTSRDLESVSVVVKNFQFHH